MRHAAAPPSGVDGSWPPRRLTVVYDDHCELCVRCRDYLVKQPTHVELRFLASSDPEVYDRYGDLPWYRIELMVITDGGHAWIGSQAFIMCLWSTIRWHKTSYRLSGRSLAPMAERFFHALSTNRSVVSGMLTPTRCSTGACVHQPAPPSPNTASPVPPPPVPPQPHTSPAHGLTAPA